MERQITKHEAEFFLAASLYILRVAMPIGAIFQQFLLRNNDFMPVPFYLYVPIWK